MAGKFGIKWDGTRMNRGLRESSPCFISRKKKNNEMGKNSRKYKFNRLKWEIKNQV
ncbi:hypothetical protein PcPA57_14730 [Pasteurella canis]|nr:hypothetical protein PcPA57_14730 [Pasteurella canis]